MAGKLLAFYLLFAVPITGYANQICSREFENSQNQIEGQYLDIMLAFSPAKKTGDYSEFASRALATTRACATFKARFKNVACKLISETGPSATDANKNEICETAEELYQSYHQPVDERGICQNHFVLIYTDVKFLSLRSRAESGPQKAKFAQELKEACARLFPRYENVSCKGNAIPKLRLESQRLRSVCDEVQNSIVR